MPIHLVPDCRRSGPDRISISRRSFLSRIGAAGAAVVLAPRLGRSDEPSSRRVWALVSDTHVHASDDKESRGQNMARNLDKATREILAERPRGVVIDGDLALSVGNAGDYAALVRHTKPLTEGGIPLHLTLGNHDHRENFLSAVPPAENGPRPVDGKHVASFVGDGLHWLLLDSLETVNAVPGRLGEHQRLWLSERLDAAPGLPAVLFVHHNPEPGSSGLLDSDRLLELIAPRRQVKAVFFGHTHTYRRWEQHGIHMVNLPATSYAFSKEQPLGWIRAALRPDGMDIELRSLDPEHAEHGKTYSLAWRAGRRVRV